MHIVAIGGSDAGISAALRAREVDPGAELTVVVADAYPNFSICGIPYYVSGEVTHWRDLAHRTHADLEAAGMRLRLTTTARKIDVAGRALHVTGENGADDVIAYDQLVIGTGAVPARPPIAGLDALGPAEGVHLLHSMDDTFAVMRTLDEQAPASAVIVGAGYIGLEMAEALSARGLAVTQVEQLPEVLPTVDPQLGALVRAQLEARGVTVRAGTAVREIGLAAPGAPGRLRVGAVGALHMRFTGDRATGRLLGVQLFGHKDAEIAKRVDIAAAAIFHGMKVDDVSDLDLSYTPPLAPRGTPSSWALRPGRARRGAPSCPIRAVATIDHPAASKSTPT
jgi:NADPH-dependent 2,4-dienoyl-CoA reductase/sulfur reductase-like enzyme